MRLNFKSLKKLPVTTMSGTDLGHVVDVIVETEAQHIIQYEVKKGLKSAFLISRDQIASIDEDKMVVYDTAVPKDERKKKERPVPPLVDTAAATEIE